MDLSNLNFGDIGYTLENNKEGITLIFLFFIMFIITFAIIKKVIFKQDDERKYAAIIGFAISLIGTYYLSQTEFMTIIQSYSAAGLIILFLLPLILLLAILYASHADPKIIKTFLVGYLIVFFYFIYSRDIELSGFQTILILGIMAALFFLENSLRRIFRPRNTPPPVTH